MNPSRKAMCSDMDIHPHTDTLRLLESLVRAALLLFLNLKVIQMDLQFYETLCCHAHEIRSSQMLHPIIFVQLSVGCHFGIGRPSVSLENIWVKV